MARHFADFAFLRGSALCHGITPDLEQAIKPAPANETSVEMNGSLPVKTIVVIQQAPHYRRDVYRALEESRELSCTFLVGSPPKNPSIPSIDVGELDDCCLLPNRWLGPFLWQHGVLWRMLNSNYDVVVFEGNANYLSTWIAAGIARLRRKRVLFWTLGWLGVDRGIKRTVRLAFYRLSHRLLLYGNAGRRLGEAAGFPARRITVVGNSVSVTKPGLSSFNAQDEHWNLPPASDVVIGAVIRLTPAKRLDLLIHAAAALRAEGVPVSVLIVGEGPEESTLRKLAEDLGVALYLPGSVYADDQLARIYERLSVTVVPSTIGLTGVQSLRFGVPAISHDNLATQAPEVEAIVPGVTGDLYREGDLQSLIDTIRRWTVSVSADRERVSQQCRSHFREHWSSDAHATRMISAISREMPLLRA